MSSDKETKTHPSDKLRKSIELWLKWDQCETTRKEIEQLKVFFFNFFLNLKKNKFFKE